MKNRSLFTLLLAAATLTATLTATAEPPTTVKICTPEWEYYTQRDGKGLYHELWNEVFTKNGVTIELVYAPYKRCDESTKERGEYDVFPGDYEATEKSLLPKYALGVDLLTVAYPKDALEKWTDQSVLEGKRVAWERGYEFNTAGLITAKVQVNEFTKLDAALQMLANNRIDFLVDYEQALGEKIKELKIEDKITVAPNVIKGPRYYMTFAKTDKSKKLIEIWDREMAKLEKSGKLQALYKKYEDPLY